MTKSNDTTAIFATLTKLHAAKKSRDEMIITLVQDGATLNKATKLYAAWAKDAGIATTLTSHKEEALAYLGEQYQADTWDARAVQDMVVTLADKFQVAESTARDYCKAYSELLEVEHPVLNPREAIFTWFKTTKDITKEKYMDYAVKELGRSQSNANEYWKGYELHLYLTSK